MNAIIPSDTTMVMDSNRTYVGFEQEFDVLRMGDIDLSIDFQLGDEDLEVSLLVESLEQQYRDLVSTQSNDFHDIQSAKEWVNTYQDKLAGLFRYLRQLTADPAT